jgi:heat shock protein HslJ
MKKILYILIIVVVVAGAYHLLKRDVNTSSDYKSVDYKLSGETVKLGTSIKYFGNEVRTDLNADGREDVAFLVSSADGKTFYAVGALNTPSGWVGTSATYVGENIAPQSSSPGDGNTIVINYAENNVGKSLVLKLDQNNLEFGEVVQNFEGEADPSKMTLTMKKWAWVSALYNDGRTITPKNDKFSITFSADGTFSASTDCNGIGGDYTAKSGTISMTNMVSTLMFCEGSQEDEFRKLLTNASGYHFTPRGELILDLKFDSGTATFR